MPSLTPRMLFAAAPPGAVCEVPFGVGDGLTLLRIPKLDVKVLSVSYPPNEAALVWARNTYPQIDLVADTHAALDAINMNDKTPLAARAQQAGKVYRIDYMSAPTRTSVEQARFDVQLRDDVPRLYPS